MKRITNTLKNKYYRYQPGEFLPVYRDGELANRRDFHIYKLKRAGLMIRNYKAVAYHYTHQRG